MIGFIVAGLVIGLLARLLLPGRQKIGIWWTLGIGLIGSIVGGGVANALNTGGVFELNTLGFVMAVIVSVGALAVAETMGLGQPPDRKKLS